ncbi:MAG TPA: hypothetical protein VLB76_03315 [Thermoanaerobaculia bacterium]|nr:hypothetical protein [Thermoanaerobaculia bacterium]
MAKPIRRTLLLAFLLGALPSYGHSGPPFPILVDQRVGPYIASVWTDPDIGMGTFFVILEAPKGGSLPAKAAVRIGVQPVSKRLPEVVYEAEPQSVKEGARYFTKVKFDKGGMWHTRILIDGVELKADVEPTPDGIIGPFASLVYVLPFLGIGFLWIKAALRRRSPAAASR